MQRIARSAWMERGTAASGGFPPINIFQNGVYLYSLFKLALVFITDLEMKKNYMVSIRGKKTIAYGEQRSVYRRERISAVFDRLLCVSIRNTTGSHQGRISQWHSLAVKLYTAGKDR